MKPYFSPELRRFLLNFLSRRWSWLVACASLHLLASIFFLQATGTDSLSQMGHTRFFFILSVSIWPIMLDVFGKPMRTLLSLPLTADSVWTGFWWLTFGFQAIASTTISLMALSWVLLTSQLAVPVETVVIWFIGQWGSLALGWCCLSLLASDPDVAKRRPVSSTIASGLWGVQSSFFVFFIPTSSPWGLVVLSGSCCTILGALFGRGLTGQFILERIGRPDASTITISPRRNHDRAGKSRGWMSLIQSNIYLLLGVPLAGLTAGALSVGLSQRWSEADRMLFTVLFCGPAVVICPGVVAMAFSSTTRVLRQLPMNGLKMAFTLLLAAWLPSLVGMLPVALILLIAQPDSSEMWSKWMVSTLTALSLVSAFSIRFGPGSPPFVAFIGLWFLFMAVMATAIGAGPPDWMVLTAPLLIAACVAWTRWEISCGRSVYRTRPI